MQVIIGSDSIAVREGLATLLACPVMACLDKGALGAAEIVLAEVLNNIVEHAYAERTGKICIDLQRNTNGVHVVVCDEGHPFPEEELPQGALPLIDTFEELPEGGFGWFLIRRLVQNLSYRRSGTQNQLSFLLPVKVNPTNTS